MKNGQTRASAKTRISTRLLTIGVCTVLVAGELLLSSVTTPQAKQQRPNIIYIMADDMGYSDIGCYGGEVNTPNIDQIAANGIKLRSFYNNARCCPTRASLLTGQYPHTVGMGYMVTVPAAKYEAGSYQGFLDNKYPTIAEDLLKSGYHTYMSGKWHVGESPEHWPRKRGFEHYFGLVSGSSSYYEIIAEEKGKRFLIQDDDKYEIPEHGFYMTDAFTDHAINFMDDAKAKNEKDGKPFFLYLAYTAPHYPLHALETDIVKYEKLYAQGWDITREKRYQKMLKLGLIDKRYQLTERPANIPSWDKATDKTKWARKMAVYAAMIDRMDQNIGKLISKLKANGQYENTLLVFLSDNGGSAENMNGKSYNDTTKKIGEKGSFATYDFPWANVSNTPFKKYKHFLHEGGLITPLIIQWPAKIKPQQGYNPQIGHVIDLVPTALELAGANSGSLPGTSLSYLWNGKTSGAKTYCWEHEGNQAIRKGNWKLIKDQEDSSWQLYDLDKDPTETHDISNENQQRVQEMMTEYRAWAKQVGVQASKKIIRSE